MELREGDWGGCELLIREGDGAVWGVGRKGEFVDAGCPFWDIIDILIDILEIGARD